MTGLFNELKRRNVIRVGLAYLVAGWVLFTDRVTPARFVRIHRMIVRFMVCFERHHLPILAHLDPDNPLHWPGRRTNLGGRQ